MKSTSKVIMAATLLMVVSLAIVLVLFLVLLAELYCSLLLRRGRRRCSLTLPTITSVPTNLVAATSADPSTSHSHLQSTSPLSSFYSQGVLQAPPSVIFPLSLQFSNNTQTKSHHLHENALTSSPEPIVNNSNNYSPTSCGRGENFVYISNPIYSNEAIEKPDTPFETPDSSPSRLEICDSTSGDDEEKEAAGGGGGGAADSPAGTPPLTPMKSLPEKASSVSLRDARSLATSGSDSNTNYGGSSSSTGSACTSPSW